MNVILDKRLSRRTLLRGVGAALALPWLEAMAPTLRASESLAKPPLRSAFMFMPNGVIPAKWTPAGDGEEFELTPILSPLANVKNDFLLLENLWNKNAVGRNGHWPKIPAYLSGGFVVRTAGRDLDIGGVTVDQVLASEFGSQTPLPSLELGVDEAYTGVDNVGGGFTRIYGSHIAWRDPNTPVSKEIIPRLAFDRLFRTGPAAPPISGFTTKQPAVVKSLAGDDTSVLDLVMEDAKSLKNKVGTQDRLKLDEYLESVRSIEQRIESSLRPQKRWINQGRFEVLRPGPGIPRSHEEHVRLMLDIMVLAFWTDSTRVSTFMFGNAQTGRNFSFIDGVSGTSYHGLSHHRNEEPLMAQCEKIATWHVAQMAYMLEKMKSLDEGGQSLLDNSQVLFGTTIRDGNSHDPHNLPLFLAGGGAGTLRPGRRLRFEKDTPLCNLYLTLLRNQGVQRESFGDSTGTLQGLS